MKSWSSRLATLMALALLLGACSTSGATASRASASQVPPTIAASVTPVPSAAPTPLGLEGTWNGTWKNTSPDTSGGTFVLTWTQTGSSLSGTIVVNGTPCLPGGTITGTITGSAISFGAVSGAIRVAYEGTVSGNQMQGTYSAPACFDAKGNWQATKS